MKGLSLMKLPDFLGFWAGVMGKKENPNNKNKRKKKTEQEQALKAELHDALCSRSKIADALCALNPSQV